VLNRTKSQIKFIFLDLLLSRRLKNITSRNPAASKSSCPKHPIRALIMTAMMKLNLSFALGVISLAATSLSAAESQMVDVLVYSGVPCGIAASIAAAPDGAKVLLI
jgi:hypothetical protein